jgi:Ribbon-helix-helix protein, copG family
MRFDRPLLEPAGPNRDCLDHRTLAAHGGRCQRWYHTSMDKTTIYLPTELKSAIKRVARQRGVSEAEVIRDSIRDAVGDHRPRPRGGLFASHAPIAREVDEHLPGFGER